MAHLYNRIVSVITKPSAERSTDEIRALLHWFSKKSRLFESVQTEVLIDVLRNCDFTAYAPDQLIIRQGERGDTFYIILSGKVSIYVNTDSVPDDPEEARPSEAAPNAPLDRKKLGNFIVQFDTGKTFGELALINRDCIRNASVVADEPTDLIVINRDLFNRSIRAPQEYDLRMREAFVRQHPLFRGWAPRYRRQAIMSLRREQLQFGMVIIRQGEPVNGITMIHSGQAKVTVDTIQHTRQYAHLAPVDTVQTRPGSRLFNNGNVTSRQSYAEAEGRLQRRNVEVCLVGENEVLGELEQILELPTYMQTVVCVQPCELMILDEKNFERLIAKRNPQVMRMLHASCEAKLRARQDTGAPLLQTLLQRLERQKAISRLKKAGADYRDPLEVLRQPVSYSMKELQNVVNFLPPRGALVDLYGPGTIFYRNRTLRNLKNSEQQRLQAKMKLKSEGPTVNTHARPPADAPSAPYALGRPQPTDIASTTRNLPAGRHDGRHGPECPICAHLNRQMEAANSAPASSHDSTARSFKDWETSNEYLSELETRMHDWLDYLHTPVHEKQRFATQIQLPSVTQLKTESTMIRPTQAPVKLQRFKPISHEAVLPGVKVVLRRRFADRDSQEATFVSAPVAAAAAAAATADGDAPSGTNAKTEFTRSNNSVLTDAIVRWDSAKRSMSSVRGDRSDGSAGSSHSGRKSKKRLKNLKNQKVVTVDEYKQLKSKMKRKEVDLANFRARVDLV